MGCGANWRPVRCSTLIAITATLAGLLVACSPRFPPDGVAYRNGRYEYVSKLCHRSIGRVETVSVPGGIAWRTRKVGEAPGGREVPLFETTDAYEVRSPSDGTVPSSGQRFRVREAWDSDGPNIIAGALFFTIGTIKDGELVDDDGNKHELGRWLSPAVPNAPSAKALDRHISMSGAPATVGRTECGSAVCVQWFDRVDRMPSKLRVEPIGDHQRDARARHKLAAIRLSEWEAALEVELGTVFGRDAD
jgi:hypothetical protein